MIEGVAKGVLAAACFSALMHESPRLCHPDETKCLSSANWCAGRDDPVIPGRTGGRLSQGPLLSESLKFVNLRVDKVYNSFPLDLRQDYGIGGGGEVTAWIQECGVKMTAGTLCLVCVCVCHCRKVVVTSTMLWQEVA